MDKIKRNFHTTSYRDSGQFFENCHSKHSGKIKLLNQQSKQKKPKALCIHEQEIPTHFLYAFPCFKILKFYDSLNHKSEDII